jgi:DNA-binding CsgD family transcriptional regulator
VGREQQLAALEQALARGATLLLVEGEAGIGKTRLLAELLAARTSGTLVARCPPLRTPCTLGPVVDAVRQVDRDVRHLGLSGLGGALRPVFPEWAHGLPPPPEPAVDATAARYRLFAALAELLGRLRTTLLVVEDAHWADDATMEFLLFLTTRQAGRPSLILTCRPEGVPERSLLRQVSPLAAGSSGLRIVLGPLDVAQTARLASSMLDGEPVSREFAAFLHERTGGIPLAVEESVRLMGDRASLVRRDRPWLRRQLVDVDLPATVRDAVLDRARRLAPDARLVVDGVAVLAEPAGESVVRVVAGLPAGRLTAGLSEALGCGLLVDDGRGLVSFRHVLAARAVYEAIPSPRRRVLHGRAGRALEALSPVPADRLAWHFREAADTDRWRRYAEQVADVALAAGDDATAGAVLHGLITRGGLPARDVARLTGRILLLAFPEDSELGDLVTVLRTALAAGDLTPTESANLRFQFGRVLIAMDEYEAGHAELVRAVPHLPRGSLQAARAMTMLGFPFGTAGTASQHLRWLRRAAGAAGPQEPSEQVRLAFDRATALLILGEAEGWTEAVRIPCEAPAPRERLHVTRGLANIASAAVLWGRYGEARRRLERVMALADCFAYSRFRNAAMATLAHVDYLTGSWSGLDAQAAALAGDDEIHSVTRREARLVAALLEAAVGARAQAADHLQRVIEDTRRRGVLVDIMEPVAALAGLRLADGDVEAALRCTGEAMDIVVSKRIWLWATDLASVRVAALTAAGRPDEAAALVSMFTRRLRDHDAPAPRAGLLTCRAILAEHRGMHSRAATWFAQAAAAWWELPRPRDGLLARERQAGCLIAAGRTDAGLALLTEVLAGLSQLGATADADRVVDGLRGHGVAARRVWRGGRRGYGDRLSPRELEVARLVAAGNTNKQIANALGRSPDTVATQLKSAMRKLGVDTRTALAVSAFAPRGGQIHPSG